MSKFLESVNNALNENNRAVIEATMRLNEEFLDNQFEDSTIYCPLNEIVAAS